MKKILFLVLAFVVSNSNSLAQAEDDIKQKLAELDYFSGVWTVQVEARLSAKGPWDTSNARSVMIKTMAAKLVEEDFTGTRVGKLFLAKTVFAVNNLTGKYQRIFADSEHGALIDFEGEKSGNSFIFDKLWTYPNKSTVKLRIVYTIVSAGEFRVESMRMPEGTTGWDVTGRMKYTRIK